MNPNIPISALPIFGPAVSPDGQWGLVPWMHGVLHPEPLQGLRNGSVTTFGYVPGGGVLAVTDGDNDLDGPPNDRTGWRVDPCGQSQTSLRDIHGVSCNSRVFPGVVISPALEKLGIRLSDFCLVSYNGAVRSAQVYDIGPTRKQGEFSLFLGRQITLVPADWSDHKAALDGHDPEDVCTLFFPGSGPGHALDPAEIVTAAHVCWSRFTSRAVESAALEAGKGSAAASGSVGPAAALKAAV